MSKKKKESKSYEIDVDKIKTFDDFKIVLKHMGLVFLPENNKVLKEMKPYLKEEKWREKKNKIE